MKKILSFLLFVVFFCLNFVFAAGLNKKESIEGIDKEATRVLLALVREGNYRCAKELIRLGVHTASYRPLSEEIRNKINGVSFKEGFGITLDDLSYIEIVHWGFDGELHYGEMIVNKNVAQEVVEIFEELFQFRFPIEKIRLIDEYDANDDKAMEDNNSLALCCRWITGSTIRFSIHSLGQAVDINPVQNPYVKGDLLLPKNGEEYVDRDACEDFKGVITENSICYKVFAKRGWTWGGGWESLKDFQHFQK